MHSSATCLEPAGSRISPHQRPSINRTCSSNSPLSPSPPRCPRAPQSLPDPLNVPLVPPAQPPSTCTPRRAPAEPAPPPTPGPQGGACLPEAFPCPPFTDDYFILPLGPAAPSPQTLLGLPAACSPSAGIAGGHQVRATTRSRPRRAHGGGGGAGRGGREAGRDTQLSSCIGRGAGGEPQPTLPSFRHLPLPCPTTRAWDPQHTGDTPDHKDTHRLPTTVPCSHPVSPIPSRALPSCRSVLYGWPPPRSASSAARPLGSRHEAAARFPFQLALFSLCCGKRLWMTLLCPSGSSQVVLSSTVIPPMP